MARRSGYFPRLPLSVEDILGYSAPGATLLGCIAAVEIWARKAGAGVSTPLTTALGAFADAIENKPEWASLVVLVAIVAFAAYILGHLISTGSSFLIERMLVFKGYGYPYQAILGLDTPNRWRSTSRHYYRATFAWLNAYLVLRYLEGHPAVVPARFQGDALATSIHVMLLVSMAALAGLTVLKLAVRVGTTSSEREPVPPRRPFKGYDDGRSEEAEVEGDVLVATQSAAPAGAWSGPSWRAVVAWFRMECGHTAVAPDGGFRQKFYNVVHIVILAFAAPYNFAARALHGYFNTRAPLEPRFVGTYKRLFARRFRIYPEEAGTNNYWLTYCHLASQRPRLWEQIRHYETLYLFARNLSASFFVAFCYFLVLFWADGFQVPAQPSPSRSQLLVLVRIPLVFWAMACLTLVRYYYLYYSYFSRLIFRSFILAERTPPPADKAKRRVRTPAKDPVGDTAAGSAA